MSQFCLHNSDVPLTDLGGGCSRKVLSHTDALMLVEVHFEEGAEGTIHTHPHTQCTYVRSGLFKFTVDGKDVIVGPGDTLCFEPNVPHGTLCLEKGVLLDAFTPMREDFLK